MREYTPTKRPLHILEQLADILAELKQHKFAEIASIDRKSPIDFSGLGYTTPCGSFSEYAKRWLAYYVAEMRRLHASGHPNAPYFANHIAPLEALLNSAFIEELGICEEEFFLSHQDFVMKNILVNGEKVSGILDWEWSGSAPREFEAKTGLDFLKTDQDKLLFNTLLEERGVFRFFDPPTTERQLFYQLIGRVYALISCYEWVSGKLEHSAKFLDQKLEQRMVRADTNFDMQAYVEKVSADIEITLQLIERRKNL